MTTSTANTPTQAVARFGEFAVIDNRTRLRPLQVTAFVHDLRWQLVMNG